MVLDHDVVGPLLVVFPGETVAVDDVVVVGEIVELVPQFRIAIWKWINGMGTGRALAAPSWQVSQAKATLSFPSPMACDEVRSQPIFSW
jgi:hypothetical protein